MGIKVFGKAISFEIESNKVFSSAVFTSMLGAKTRVNMRPSIDDLGFTERYWLKFKRKLSVTQG